MKTFPLAMVITVSFVGSGCQPPPEKHYTIQAEVLTTAPQHQMVTVKHGDIPGLMPAMTMSYMVAEPKQLESLKPGDKITADLVVSNSKGRLEKIVLITDTDTKPSTLK